MPVWANMHSWLHIMTVKSFISVIISIECLLVIDFGSQTHCTSISHNKFESIYELCIKLGINYGLNINKNNYCTN